jgi:hypothetical protein
VTAISLLSIKVDSPPEQIRLDFDYGLTLRLEAGVHLDLTDASPATCRALAHAFETAAALKAGDKAVAA